MLSRHLADPFQDCITIFGQIEGVQAPVVRVCSSLNEPALLEIVQNRHQAAGMNPQLRCELLLAQTLCNTHEPESLCSGRCEFENRQSVSELGRGIRS